LDKSSELLKMEDHPWVVEMGHHLGQVKSSEKFSVPLEKWDQEKSAK